MEVVYIKAVLYKQLGLVCVLAITLKCFPVAYSTNDIQEMNINLKSTYISSKSCINNDKTQTQLNSCLPTESKSNNDTIAKELIENNKKAEIEKREMEELAAQQAKEAEEAEKAAQVFRGPLLEGNYVDSEYDNSPVSLSASDRSLLEHLVMGEAGGQGFEGCALVAQCIRDAIVYRDGGTVAQVRKNYQYSGGIYNEPNQDVLDAVSFIFDNGGMAVQHKIFFFYNPQKCSSSFHNTQQFVIEYENHRFYSTWN